MTETLRKLFTDLHKVIDGGIWVTCDDSGREYFSVSPKDARAAIHALEHGIEHECKAEVERLCGDVERMFGENVKKNNEIARLLDENERLRSCLSDAAENRRLIMGEYKQLREENERLRQDLAIRDESEQEKVIDYLSGQSVDWEDGYRALVSENAKLRELVRDAWGNGHPDKSCGDCEIMDECHKEIEEAHKKGNGRWNTRCLFERRIEDRMRDLGIEVG